MRRILLFYVAVRVMLGLLTLSHGALDYHGSAPNWPTTEAGVPYRMIPSQAWDGHGRWDSRGYLAINFFGYDTVRDRRSNTAFFPGYPWLTNAVFEGLVAPFISDRDTEAARASEYAARFHTAHVVSSLAFVLALFLIHRLASRHFGRGVAERTCYLLIALPPAIVFSCILTESVFLALVVGSFLLFEKRWYLSSALLAACAATVRSFGVMLVVPLLIMHAVMRRQEQRGFGLRWMVLFIIPFGTVAVLLVMAEANGHIDAYFHQQNEFFGHEDSPTLMGFYHLVQPTDKSTTVVHLRTIFQLTMVLAGAVGLFVFARRAKDSVLRWPGLAYGVIGIVLPIIADRPISMPRYVMVLFPAIIGLAMALTRPVAFRVVIALCVVLQGLIWVTWLHNVPILI